MTATTNGTDKTHGKPESQNASRIGRLQRLLQQARGGDPAELQAVQRVLDEHPETWQTAGDLGLQAEAKIIELAGGSRMVNEQSIIRTVSELRTSLGGESPRPMVRLLVDRVALSWLLLTHLDLLLAKDPTGKRAEELRKRHDLAHRQFLQSMRALDLVQHSLTPQQRGDGPRRVAPIPEVLLERMRGKRK